MTTRYDETVEWLFTQLPVFSAIGPGAYKPGLDNAHALDAAFGHSHRRFKSIHVAGTNGKGSTSHSLAAVLAAAGLKVGLFTSPHLVDFRERIRINGEKISREAVVDFVDRYRSMGLSSQPSFFELTTIMAFDYFAAQGVDIAVIETGLGGRLDTTNIITPLATIVTNVSLDHTALLGDTIAAIAAEKAGIFKRGVPAIVSEAEGEARRVFAETAERVGAPITFACDAPRCVGHEGDAAVFDITDFPAPGPEKAVTDLPGPWQAMNINGALACLKILGLATRQAVASGLSSVCTTTGLMGRWMTIAHNPETICDTGHNIGAWQYLAPRLEGIAAHRDVRIALGFASDKDAESIFAMLPHAAHYYLAAPAVKRARPVADLAAMAEANGLDYRTFDTVTDAVEAARRDCGPDSLLYIGGSNFVVAEVLEALEKEK